MLYTVVEGGEKLKFDIVACNYDINQKVKAIKEIRDILGEGISLAKAKVFIESLPQTICHGVDNHRAGDVKKRLEAVGIRVEIR